MDGCEQTLTYGCEQTLTYGCEQTLTSGCEQTLTSGCEQTLTYGCVQTLTYGCEQTLTYGCEQTLPPGTFACPECFGIETYDEQLGSSMAQVRHRLAVGEACHLEIDMFVQTVFDLFKSVTLPPPCN